VFIRVHLWFHRQMIRWFVCTALLLAAAAGAGAAVDPGYDSWGGWRGISATATGRFRTQRIDGVWWLITPDGHGFFSVGVDHLRPGGDFSPALGRAPYYDNIIARYGNEAGWAAATLPRLHDLGLNTIGAFSEPERFPNAIAYTVRLELSAYAPEVPGVPPPLVARVTRDYFDPAFASGVATNIASLAGPCAADPWCIGVFTDNELALNQSLAQVLPYLDAYLLLPAGAPGKLAVQDFFAARYGGDIDAFNAVWGLQLASFDDLQVLSALAPAPAPPPAQPTGSAAQIADRRAFDVVVAERFHRVTYDALRALAPDLLILGSRLLILSTRPEVVAAIAPYVDVMTVNYYEIAPEILAIAPDYAADYGIPFARMFDDLDAMYRIAEKPFLIGEFSYRAADAGLPNSLPPFFPTLPTQNDRAQALGTYLRRVLARPYLVGAHWFQYMDQPATGRFDGENQNFGLVTITDDLWPAVTDRLRFVSATAAPRRWLAPGAAGGRANDCLVEWASTAPLLPTRRVSARARFVCRDGDPSCDTDTVVGQCTIEVQPCATVDDSRLPCSAAVPSAIAVERLAPVSDDAVVAALQASLDTITVPNTVEACGPAVPIVIPLNGRAVRRRALQTRASIGDRADRDAVRLVCVAAP
jgi:agarase